MLQATSIIPIVAYTADAVESRFIKSLARPGGNLTGVVEPFDPLVGKRMQLLIQATAARQIAFLSPMEGFEPAFSVAQNAAGPLGVQLVRVAVRHPDRPDDIARAVKSARTCTAGNQLVATSSPAVCMRSMPRMHTARARS